MEQPGVQARFGDGHWSVAFGLTVGDLPGVKVLIYLVVSGKMGLQSCLLCAQAAGRTS